MWPRTFFVNVRSKTSDRALDNPEPKALILQGKLKSHFSYVPGDEARLCCASGCFVSLDMAAVPLLGHVGSLTTTYAAHDHSLRNSPWMTSSINA